jgi:diketogulonate reductase-like aldo/keto reductase
MWSRVDEVAAVAGVEQASVQTVLKPAGVTSSDYVDLFLFHWPLPTL